MLNVKYKYNGHWQKDDKPEVTVITPFYNRGYCLERVFQSVKGQTYHNFEYIIVDDGSVEDNDSIVTGFMDTVEFPVLYIKKKNGGVHTARNIAIKNSRGKYIVCIDSDDELVPEALQIMIDAWAEIPEGSRNEYFEVKFRCKNQEGKCVGSAFPKDINSRPYSEIVKIYESIKAEHIGMRCGDIMRANPWPEPDNVTFVTENVLWCTLRRIYKSYFSNEIVRIYHTETTDSLTSNTARKKTVQNIKNSIWNVSYYMNHKKIFYDSGKRIQYIRDVIRFCIFDHILTWKVGKHQRYLTGLVNYIMVALFWIPCIPVARIYIKKRMDND